MKILTLNFLTCAVRNCKTSPAAFPLHVRDAELEIVEIDYQPEFLQNVLPRLDMKALEVVAAELGLKLPEIAATTGGSNPGADVEMSDETIAEPANANEGTQDANEPNAIQEEDLKKLHRLLLETQIEKGMLVCGNCGHEYKIMEGIPNFLLPPHLV